MLFASASSNIGTAVIFYILAGTVMKSDEKEGKHAGRGRRGYEYVAPATVLVTGLLATALLVWTYRIAERQRELVAWADTAMVIQIRTATFHRMFETALAEGSREGMEKAFPLLEEAVKLSEGMLHGGRTERGLILPPLDTTRYRMHGEGILSRLTALKRIALSRNRNPDLAVAGSTLKKEFDAAFAGSQEEGRALEDMTERALSDYQDRARRLHFLIIFVWTSLIAGTTMWLTHSERRRRQAEMAVEEAYREMERQVRIRTSELSDANRNLEGEIAERKRAEFSLRTSEGEYRRLSAQFRILLDTIPDAILLVSRDLNVIWSNKGATAFSRSGPTGIRCHELFHGSSSPCTACPAVKSYESGLEENIQTTTPDGRQWDIRAVPVRREDGTIEGVIEVATDVTDKIALQREAMRAAHLASLGELSAGVAHEINNPINGIINYAQILHNRSDPGNGDREIAERILKEGHRIADIVSGLLSFARVRKEEKEPAFIGDILGEALSLTQSQMGKEGIRVLTAVPPILPEIVANPQQVMQVFLNIISNARYALNEKYPDPHEDKVLEILAERIEGDGGPCVRMTFRDRGTGIPADLMDKVITPFFTTKPGAKGTGLGLSICAGIVSDHGGKLALESMEGEFTKVTVDLPVAGGGNGQDPRHR
jgi:C4-dicarboxylate-specific signal transduction histidine kinase